MFDLGQDWTGKGFTRREELENLERQTGRVPKEFQAPPLAFGFERGMRIWQKLHRHRQTGMGLGVITYPDFHAYSIVHSDPISDSDIAVIEIIDEEFFASRAAAEESRTKQTTKKR